MQCQRCQGTMVVDYFVDLEESGELWMSGWRCLMCGNVVDPTILNHQRAQKKRRELVEATKSHSDRNVAPVAVLSGKRKVG